MKSDSSIRNICIAAIKRKTFQPIKYPFTRIFETELMSAISADICSKFTVEENELPIAQTFVNISNWTLVTTKRIINSMNGNVQIAHALEIDFPWNWGDFKGYKDKSITVGLLKINNQENFKIYIETGKAAMIIIYAIDTLTAQIRSSSNISK